MIYRDLDLRNIIGVKTCDIKWCFDKDIWNDGWSMTYLITSFPKLLGDDL